MRALVIEHGSEAAAYDDTIPWIACEQRLLRDAFEAGVPRVARIGAAA
jgi:hypothetical protein